jgi:hypothetical protein
VGGDGVLVDLLRRQPLGQDGPDGVGDLGPTSVVEGDAEREAGVGRGAGHGLVDVVQHRVGDPAVPPPGHHHPDVAPVQLDHALGHHLTREAHEVRHLRLGARPVLGGEAVDGQRLEPEPDGGVDHPVQRLLAGGVADRAVQALALGPPAVAVHDHGDVARKPGTGGGRGIGGHRGHCTVHAFAG